ncbi:hypothetical protein Y032_0002g822 [Ancylostoma ceylanicum]|uniref:Uncharacterized protein n=1 Tax=Ancylostoma ceylanicum TaxID=53326 RepID=A0A016W1M3_9BILA|nr:hypothetical protein Y032_0002g822 [Ancylostoma ceylanicum]
MGLTNTTPRMYGPSPAAGADAPRLQASLRDTGLPPLGVAPPCSFRGLCADVVDTVTIIFPSSCFVATVPRE